MIEIICRPTKGHKLAATNDGDRAALKTLDKDEIYLCRIERPQAEPARAFIENITRALAHLWGGSRTYWTQSILEAGGYAERLDDPLKEDTISVADPDTLDLLGEREVEKLADNFLDTLEKKGYNAEELIQKYYEKMGLYDEK